MTNHNINITSLISLWMTCLLLTGTASAISRYGTTLCQTAGYHCIKVQKGENWATLFPDADQRDLVKRVNRMNIDPARGSIIAVPQNLDKGADYLTYAPFESYLSEIKRQTIVVDQDALAWGAYGADGHLVNWGPTSGGQGYCKDVQSKCRTVTGTFTVYRKGNEHCKSTKFPVGRGGAPTPYCMFFHGGYALHGSQTVPGYNASHGCVRLFHADAEWLNKEFIHVGSTQVVIKPLHEAADATPHPVQAYREPAEASPRQANWRRGYRPAADHPLLR